MLRRQTTSASTRFFFVSTSSPITYTSSHSYHAATNFNSSSVASLSPRPHSSRLMKPTRSSAVATQVLEETMDSRIASQQAEQRKKVAQEKIEDDIVAMASEKGFFSVSQSTKHATTVLSDAQKKSFLGSSSGEQHEGDGDPLQLQQQAWSDDPAFRFKSTAAEDFFMDINKRRKLLKPTIQQLEFPSAMTERITAASSSRVGALYQLHYSDTNVREIVQISSPSSSSPSSSSLSRPLETTQVVPVELKGLSQQDYLDGKTYLEKEASGQVPLPSAASTISTRTATTNDDVGFLFVLYTENIPTEGALSTIAGRFGVRKTDLVTLHQYSKEQCTTQIAFAKMSSLSREQILSINHMRFPGFCIKTSIFKNIHGSNSNINNNDNCYNKSNSNQSLFILTRGEFSMTSAHVQMKGHEQQQQQQQQQSPPPQGQPSSLPSPGCSEKIRLVRNEVTTLLRRVQVAGNEESVRSVLDEIKRHGAINYFTPIQQESFIYGFRRLQDAKFKSAVLQLLRHRNIRPELRQFLLSPSQATAVAARKAIGNEVARGMLRTFIDTNSYFRTIEATPGDFKSLMYRSARRVAWNTMASKRVRSETVSVFCPGPVRVKPRVGDFVLINRELRRDVNDRRAIHWDDVKLIESDDELRSMMAATAESDRRCELDIVLPVPSFGALTELEQRYCHLRQRQPSSANNLSRQQQKKQQPLLHPADFMRTCLREVRLLGLVETPSESFSEEEWKTLLNIRTSSPSSAASESLITFRPLLMNTSKIFDEEDKIFKVEVAVDPAPTAATVFDCNRVLLNDRLLLQGDRRNRTGLLDAYLTPDQHDDLMMEMRSKNKNRPEEQEQEKARPLLSGLKLDSLITSKLLVPAIDQQQQNSSSSSSSSSFTLKRSEEIELRRKLKLPPPPFSIDKLQSSWGISDSTGIYASIQQQQQLLQQKLEQNVASQHPVESPSRLSSSTFRSAKPLSDTSRLSTVVTALVQVQLQPSMLPCLLRETLNLHGVMSEDDAKLQQKIHATLRSVDTVDSLTWNSSFCPVCYSTTHDQSAECPLHRRRMAGRLARRERMAMAKEADQNRLSGGELDDNEESASAANLSFSSGGQHASSSSSSSAATIVVKISRDANSKGKWGVKVDKNLILASGCGELQPSLAPYSSSSTSASRSEQVTDAVGVEWKVVRVGNSPVATFEQLKLALSMSGNEAELALKRA